MANDSDFRGVIKRWKEIRDELAKENTSQHNRSTVEDVAVTAAILVLVERIQWGIENR